VGSSIISTPPDSRQRLDVIEACGSCMSRNAALPNGPTWVPETYGHRGCEPVVDAQTPPRRMFGEALGVRLPLTTLCNGAMVDVIEQPVELRDDADC
jgi:hypothetical protein